MNLDDRGYIISVLESGDTGNMKKFDNLMHSIINNGDYFSCKELIQMLVNRKECQEVDFLIIKTIEAFNPDVYMHALSDTLLEESNVGEPVRVMVARVLNAHKFCDKLVTLLKSTRPDNLIKLLENLSNWPGRDTLVGDKLRKMLIRPIAN